jgi:hypothetical protein
VKGIKEMPIPFATMALIISTFSVSMATSAGIFSSSEILISQSGGSQELGPALLVRIADYPSTDC